MEEACGGRSLDVASQLELGVIVQHVATLSLHQERRRASCGIAQRLGFTSFCRCCRGSQWAWGAPVACLWPTARHIPISNSTDSTDSNRMHCLATGGSERVTAHGQLSFDDDTSLVSSCSKGVNGVYVGARMIMDMTFSRPCGQRSYLR